MVARNTTELSKVAQQRIRDWAASGWSWNDKYIGWRAYKLRSNMDIIQFEDIYNCDREEYTLRDLNDLQPNEQGVGHFKNSIAMSLDEALVAIDLASMERYRYIRMAWVNRKMEETRRLATAEYGSW